MSVIVPGAFAGLESTRGRLFWPLRALRPPTRFASPAASRRRRAAPTGRCRPRGQNLNFQKSRNFQIWAPDRYMYRLVGLLELGARSSGAERAKRRRLTEKPPRVDPRPANEPGTIRDVRQSTLEKLNFGKIRKNHEISRNLKISDSGSWDSIGPWEQLLIVGASLRGGRREAGSGPGGRGERDRTLADVLGAPRVSIIVI